MTNEKYKSLLMRFIRGGISGAMASMITVMGAGVTQQGVSSLQDLKLWYASLLLAGLVGFTSGVILTIDKWSRME